MAFESSSAYAHGKYIYKVIELSYHHCERARCTLQWYSGSRRSVWLFDGA